MHTVPPISLSAERVLVGLGYSSPVNLPNKLISHHTTAGYDTPWPVNGIRYTVSQRQSMDGPSYSPRCFSLLLGGQSKDPQMPPLSSLVGLKLKSSSLSPSHLVLTALPQQHCPILPAELHPPPSPCFSLMLTFPFSLPKPLWEDACCSLGRPGSRLTSNLQLPTATAHPSLFPPVPWCPSIYNGAAGLRALV